jgi:D-glucosaminate-6-phosphate ammonia-lyase
VTIYDRLGVRPVVNAAGTLTRLGGTLMCGEALEAMREAAQSAVAIEELQEAASRVIAGHTGAEAGLVTSGAFGALALAAGACIAGLDVRRMNRMPHYGWEQGAEIVICRHHRNSYDKAFEVGGARLVEVGFLDRSLGVGVREVEAEEIEAGIGSRTVAVAYVAMQGVGPELSTVAQVAHGRELPVIVDAANQVPPIQNLRRFVEDGADLVCMSGGKAFRGPQSSGFLLGRRDLVASALLQQVDMDVAPSSWTPPKEFVDRPLNGVPRHGFGRGFKVGKEEIAGAVAALDAFVLKEPEYQAEWLERCRRFAAALTGMAGVEAVMIPRETTGRVPLVEVVFTPSHRAAQVSRELREGVPSIHLNERRVGEGRLTFNPVGLGEGQEDIVASGIRRRLGQ